MNNPFQNETTFADFAREMRKDCEHTRNGLLLHPEFARFVALSGTIEVIPSQQYAQPKNYAHTAILSYGGAPIGVCCIVGNYGGVRKRPVVMRGPWGLNLAGVAALCDLIEGNPAVRPTPVRMRNEDAYHEMPADRELTNYK